MDLKTEFMPEVHMTLVQIDGVNVGFLKQPYEDSEAYIFVGSSPYISLTGDQHIAIGNLLNEKNSQKTANH